MPRWHLDGEVKVHSGQVLNPLVKVLVLRSCHVDSLGGTLVHRCVNKSLVYISMGKVSMSAIPAKICFAYSLVHLSLINVLRGSWVKIIPSAWEK